MSVAGFCADVFADRIADLFAPLLKGGFVTAFEEQPRLGLGAATLPRFSIRSFPLRRNSPHSEGAILVGVDGISRRVDDGHGEKRDP